MLLMFLEEDCIVQYEGGQHSPGHKSRVIFEKQHVVEVPWILV